MLLARASPFTFNVSRPLPFVPGLSVAVMCIEVASRSTPRDRGAVGARAVAAEDVEVQVRT